MSNPHQALIEEKVAELRQNHCHSKVDPLKNKHFFLKSASAHNTKLLFADIEQTLQATIDTVSMIVREEEAVEYNKIIDTVLEEERERASEYMTPEDGAAYLEALKPPPDID